MPELAALCRRDEGRREGGWKRCEISGITVGMAGGGYRGYSYFRVCKPEDHPGVYFGSLPDHLRCKRIAKSTGERCRCMKVKGSTLCRTHGGKRPGMKMSRAKELRIAARLRGERPKHYWCD